MFNDFKFMQKDLPLDERIYDYIKTMGAVSLAELQRVFGEEFEGDMDIGFLDRNILWWRGVSQEAVEAIEKLLKEKKTRPHPSNVLVYLMDGAVPTIPVAKRLNHFYKKPRWFPVVFWATK